MAVRSRRQDSRTSTESAKDSLSSSKSSSRTPVNLPQFNFKRSKNGVTKDAWLASWKAARKQSPWLKLLKPAQETVKKLQALFKPTLDELDKCETSLKQKVLKYRQEAEMRAERERAELTRKAEEAAAAGKAKQATALAMK